MDTIVKSAVFLILIVRTPGNGANVPLEKEQILQLIYDLCIGGKVPEVGLMNRFSDHERSHVYCRQQATLAVASEDDPHKPDIPQTIFVQSPSEEHRHRVIVNTTNTASGQPFTNVYVVPPNITNQYSVDIVPLQHDDNAANNVHGKDEETDFSGQNKPTVYFLNKNPIPRSATPVVSNDADSHYYRPRDSYHLTDDELHRS